MHNSPFPIQRYRLLSRFETDREHSQRKSLPDLTRTLGILHERVRVARVDIPVQPRCY